MINVLVHEYTAFSALYSYKGSGIFVAIGEWHDRRLQFNWLYTHGVYENLKQNK